MRRQYEIGTAHGQRQRTWHRFQRFDNDVIVIVFSVGAVGRLMQNTVIIIVVDVVLGAIIGAIGSQHGVVDARSQRMCVRHLLRFVRVRFGSAGPGRSGNTGDNGASDTAGQRLDQSDGLVVVVGHSRVVCRRVVCRGGSARLADTAGHL